MSVASINLGRVKGNMWYAGTQIGGSSTTPNTYDTGIQEAAIGDLYLNSDNSNVFQCVSSGDSETALWVWVANIRGNDANVINNLTSDSTTSALSARMGKQLLWALNNAKIYPTEVDISSNIKGYSIELIIENVECTITMTTYAGREVTYDFVPVDTDLYTTVIITIDVDSGFTTQGAVLENVEVSDGHIISVQITGEDDVIYTFNPNVWDEMKDIEKNVGTGLLISDGADTYRTAQISKRINNERISMFPLTHAKATWYSKTNNITMYDKINTLDNAIGAFATDTAGTHNSLYRGAQLDSLDMAAVASGTFSGMYIGDYVIVNSHKYTIGAFNPKLGRNVSDNHILLVTDILYDAAFNSTDDYKRSKHSYKPGTDRL